MQHFISASGYYLQTFWAEILTFGLVIFLHELGHFLMCRKLGVRVEKFAFGMGPELFGVTRGETRYSVRALPLGGFVKLAGEEITDCTGKPDEYYSQAWYRRLAIVYAGPVMNYLLAFCLFTGVIYWKGLPETSDEPVIGNLATGFPADRAGIHIGDRVLSVDGSAVATWKQLSGAVHAKPKKEITLRYSRGGKEFTARLTTRLDEGSGNGVIGIVSKSTFKPVGPLTAVGEGAAQCYNLTEYTVRTIASKIHRRQRPDLAGPVGIFQMVHRAAHSGWDDLIFLIGLISVAIGFFNLLPVPLLDGGWAVMFFWEGISRRKLTTNATNRANSVGLVFLGLLLLFATYSDLLRWREDHAARPAPAAAATP